MGITNFSVILPVHNEESLLPYSLPSVFRLDPSEVLIILDRCVDSSEKVAKRIAKRFGYKHLRFVKVNRVIPGWSTHLGLLRFVGELNAKNDLVMWTASDLVLDIKMSKSFNLLGKDGVELVSFMHRDFPLQRNNLLKRLYLRLGLRGLGNHRFVGAVLFYSRFVAWSVESIESLKKCNHSCDTHLVMSINRKFRSRCVLSDTVHFRPWAKERSFLRGRLYWSIGKRGWITTLLASLGMLQPSILKGYIKERYGNTTRRL